MRHFKNIEFFHNTIEKLFFPVTVKMYFAVVLLFLLNGNGQCSDYGYSCEQICYPEALCWYDEHHVARCEDRCQPNPCDPGYYCITEKGWCGNESCRPEAVCYPDNKPLQNKTCKDIICHPEALCWYDENNPPTCEDHCQPNPCDSGYHCVTQKGPCNTDKCKPQPICYPNNANNTNPCKDIFCYPEALCWYDQNNPAKCEDHCQPNPCEPGYYCITERGSCGTDNCRPRPVCYPSNTNNTSPCKDIFCYPQALCWYDKHNPAKCEDRCQPNPCDAGYHCITERGYCGDDTCRPVFACYPDDPKKPANPCKDKVCYPEALCWFDKYNPAKCEDLCLPNPCQPGYYCITERGWCDNGTKNCRPHAVCYPQYSHANPCDGYNCPQNTLCWFDKSTSYNPKCGDPCRTTKCPGGYVCRPQVGSCGNSSCPPVGCCHNPCDLLHCPENNFCYFDGKQGKCLNPCSSKPCPHGRCLTERGSCGNSSCPPVGRCYSPCDTVRCGENSLCYYDGETPKCVNPCPYPEICPSNTKCVTQVGSCGTAACAPTARCEPIIRPPSSCKGIKCPANKTCTLVDTLEYSQVPTCDGNPCIRPRQRCCSVRDANGTCNNDGCYVKFKKNSCIKPNGPCQVEKVCLDPCRVERKQCPFGTSCYKNQVECFTEPCNPITTCRNACDTPKTGMAPVCYSNQKCEKIYVNCAPDEYGNYDPYTCKALEYCRNKN